MDSTLVPTGKSLPGSGNSYRFVIQSRSISSLICVQPVWPPGCSYIDQTKWRIGSLGCEFRPEFAPSSDPFNFSSNLQSAVSNYPVTPKEFLPDTHRLQKTI